MAMDGKLGGGVERRAVDWDKVEEAFIRGLANYTTVVMTNAVAEPLYDWLIAHHVEAAAASAPTPGGWRSIETIPQAMHLLVCRFDELAGEWVVGVAMRDEALAAGLWKFWRYIPTMPNGDHPSPDDSPAEAEPVAGGIESFIKQGLARNISVAAVDAIHGYTMEFAPAPDHHRDQYDSMEAAVEYELRSGFSAEALRSALCTSTPPDAALREVVERAIAEGEAIGAVPTHDTYGDRRRLMLGVTKMLHHLRAALQHQGQT